MNNRNKTGCRLFFIFFLLLFVLPKFVFAESLSEKSVKPGVSEKMKGNTENTDQLLEISGETALGEGTERNLLQAPSNENPPVSLAMIYVEGIKQFDFAYQVLELMNAERQKKKLSPLNMDKALQNMAMERAAEINVNFSHTRPNGLQYGSIFEQYHYQVGNSGENIAGGHSSPEAVFKEWMVSASHRANMLNSNYKSVGIGVFTQGGIIYWTEVFSDQETSDNKQLGTEKEAYQIEVDRNNEIVATYTESLKMKPGEKQQLFLYMRNQSWPSVTVELGNQGVDWHADDSSIADFDETGTLIAKKIGTTNFNGVVKTNPDWAVNQTVTVEYMIESPTLVAENVSLIAGSNFDPLKEIPFEAFDYQGNDLKQNVVVLSDNVDVKKTGNYQVVLKVTDYEGRTTEKTIQITVTAEAPTLQVTNITIDAGDTFDPRKAVIRASDRVDGDLKDKVTASSFDSTKEGAYQVTYTVKNSNNLSTSKRGTVIVKADPLVLTVRNITIQQYTTFDYKMAIVRATDQIDGDLREKVNITKDTVNTDKIGTYQVEYVVSNSEGLVVKKKAHVSVVKQRPSILYQTHIQSIGWQDYRKDGYMSGSTGKSLRLEGIKINLINNSAGGDILYSTHVQKIGWQDEVKNDELAGTTGKKYRLEAIKIQLTGAIAKQYDVYYRVHSQRFGWLSWAKNGAPAGTEAYGYRLEGIEIQLVEKNEMSPGETTMPYQLNTKVEYTTHIQSIGWQSYVSNGQMAGTSGKSYRLEGLKIRLNHLPVLGGIEYATHVQQEGWQNFVEEDQLSGTSGKALRLEAVKIRLTGQLAEEYDICYRVHAQRFGWLGWTKNGEAAGTEGYAYRLEAIEIQLIKKGEEKLTNDVLPFEQKVADSDWF